MVTEIVAEGEVAALFDSLRLTQVDVVGMWPAGGPVEKRIGRIVRVWDVRIAELEQRAHVSIQRMQAFH
jgi:hypothetical protein